MIKNLIFDVGEVLLGYRWKDMLLEHGLSEEDAEEVGTTVFNDVSWNLFDLGEMNTCEVITEYGRKYPALAENISWFLNHAELMPVKRPDVWERMLELKEKGYRIYLLSNYSEELFEKHTREAEFLNYIDGKVVSGEIGIAKPDVKIYEYLFKEYELNPQECKFFDDRKENIEAGCRCGMEGEIITSREQLLELLEEL